MGTGSARPGLTLCPPAASWVLRSPSASGRTPRTSRWPTWPAGLVSGLGAGVPLLLPPPPLFYFFIALRLSVFRPQSK